MPVHGHDRPDAAVGTPIDRIDGRLKVTGKATYAGDHAPDTLEGGAPLFGWIVEAPHGPGRIRRLDTSVAARQPGVVRVLTHLDRTHPVRPWGQPEDADRFEQSHALLEDARVRWAGQPVALVVAETLEAARGAALYVEVDVTLDDDAGAYGVTGHELAGELEVPDALDGDQDADVCRGDDLDATLVASDATVDAVYTTAAIHSAAMEPHTTIATWDGETLVVRVAIQIVASAVTGLANTLCLDEDQVRVICPFTGGGFGSKLGIHCDAVLASLAAIELGRPVKVALTRRGTFTGAPHRGNTWQRVRLGASRDGRLLGVAHDSVQPMARDYEFAEPLAAQARAAYRCDALHTTHRSRLVDMPPIDSMRAPGEAIGSLALESAVDELARELDLDPLELRLANLAETEPMSGRPFASYDLGRCLREGAEAFGWASRPGPHRDGRWRVGYGMAAATRPNFLVQAGAHVDVDRDGKVRAALDMTEIGGGTYTIFAQIVAEALGVPLADVTLDLGDSRSPASSGSGGSFGASSSGSALHRACMKLRARLVEVVAAGDVPLSSDEAAALRFEGGRLHGPSGSLALGEVVALTGDARIGADGQFEPGDDFERYAQYMYGAQFVELGVDAVSGEVRLRRVLGAFSFGRVLNHKTARSQLLGGMVYGIGGAINETLMLDRRWGSFVNRDFAEYHLAVNRDIPELEVLILETPDEKCGELASKGVGELGVVAIGAAIANAVYDATGVRVRDFPITLDKVLEGLEG